MDVTSQPLMTNTKPQSQSMTISLEVVAYSILIIFSLVLRLAELDTVPMTMPEAEQAVATWHTMTDTASVIAPIPDSPLTYWMQRISFGLFGASEFSSRLPSVLGGLLLILTPLAFRPQIGASRAFIMALFLAISPIPFIVSRTGASVVWSAIFALLAFQMLWRYWQTRQANHALWLTTFTILAVLLTSPSAILAFTGVVFAMFATLMWVILIAPDEYDQSGDAILQQVREFRQSFPWLNMALVAIALIAIIPTGFMFYPNGIGHVAELVNVTFSGIGSNASTLAPPAWSLLTLIVYNPVLIIFALLGVLSATRQSELTIPMRFALMWFLVNVLLTFVYQGTRPEFAIWLSLPLIWITSDYIMRLIADHKSAVFWIGQFVSEDGNVFTMRYWWVKWAVGFTIFSLFMMLSVHYQELTRHLTTVPTDTSFGDLLTLLLEPLYLQFRYSAIWFVISIMFMIVGYFLSASIWGNTMTLQGYGIGLVSFALLSGLGGAWNASVINATNPLELWHLEAPTEDVSLLRTSLYDIAQRDTRGFPLFPIYAVKPESADENYQLEWLLRDFPNANIAVLPSDVARQQVILMPDALSEFDLQGSYVGQSFVLSRQWSLSQLPSYDVSAWLSQRRSRLVDFPSTNMIFWLRQDVFEAIPVDERP